jgi:hypothetical protein
MPAHKVEGIRVRIMDAPLVEALPRDSLRGPQHRFKSHKILTLTVAEDGLNPTFGKRSSRRRVGVSGYSPVDVDDIPVVP